MTQRRPDSALMVVRRARPRLVLGAKSDECRTTVERFPVLLRYQGLHVQTAALRTSNCERGTDEMHTYRLLAVTEQTIKVPKMNAEAVYARGAN
jgi:hypothetical protein